MEFTGRIYYDFASAEVYRLYRLLVRAQQRGVDVDLEWCAFPSGDEAPDRSALAAAEIVRAHDPERHGRFVQAVLAGVHMEKIAVGDPDLIRIAGRVAGVPDGLVATETIVDTGHTLLEASIVGARELGVSAVPTIYRHGPVVRVRTTTAVDAVDPVSSIRLIDGMLEDDAIWELAKP